MRWQGYVVLCQTPGCGAPAVYKVAAEWSDGVTAELKTYALCCSACLPTWYAQACRKRAECRLAPGETLSTPGIYEYQPGKRDKELRRRTDLETWAGDS
jgi:hypothetical protein